MAGDIRPDNNSDEDRLFVDNWGEIIEESYLRRVVAERPEVGWHYHLIGTSLTYADLYQKRKEKDNEGN